MLPKALHGMLDIPFVYSLAQVLFAPGHRAGLEAETRRIREGMDGNADALDVGCGPVSRLEGMDLALTGCDLTPRIASEYARRHGRAVAASGFRLPFRDASFDSAWSFLTLHHLSDAEAIACLREMRRVTRRGGRIVVIDATLTPWHQNPMAWIVRRLDKGEFMRSREALTGLLARESFTEIRPMKYSWYRLEGLTAIATS